jgi:hypothetical protein
VDKYNTIKDLTGSERIVKKNDDGGREGMNEEEYESSKWSASVWDGYRCSFSAVVTLYHSRHTSRCLI